MAEYVARKGSFINDKDAAVVGAELDRVFGEDGARTPERTLDAAAKKRSPLHRFFDWSDSTAGHQWRLHQARMLLSSIEIVLVPGQRTKAYHSVRISEREKAYVPARVVFQSPEFASQVVERARAELEGWEERYRQYEELRAVLPLISQAIREMAA